MLCAQPLFHYESFVLLGVCTTHLSSKLPAAAFPPFRVNAVTFDPNWREFKNILTSQVNISASCLFHVGMSRRRPVISARYVTFCGIGWCWMGKVKNHTPLMKKRVSPLACSIQPANGDPDHTRIIVTPNGIGYGYFYIQTCFASTASSRLTVGNPQMADGKCSWSIEWINKSAIQREFPVLDYTGSIGSKNVTGNLQSSDNWKVHVRVFAGW